MRARERVCVFLGRRKLDLRRLGNGEVLLFVYVNVEFRVRLWLRGEKRKH